MICSHFQKANRVLVVSPHIREPVGIPVDLTGSGLILFKATSQHNTYHNELPELVHGQDAVPPDARQARFVKSLENQ